MVTKQTWQTADDSLEMAGKQCLPTEGSRTTTSIGGGAVTHAFAI